MNKFIDNIENKVTNIIVDKLLNESLCKEDCNIVANLKSQLDTECDSTSCNIVDKVQSENVILDDKNKKLQHEIDTLKFENSILQQNSKYLATYSYICKNIANTSDNRNMIKLLRKHLNKELSLVIRGRGSRKNKSHANQSYIALDIAETFAIYIRKK